MISGQNFGTKRGDHVNKSQKTEAQRYRSVGAEDVTKQPTQPMAATSNSPTIRKRNQDVLTLKEIKTY